MEQNIKQIGGGLLPLPPDKRDFSFGKVFGTVDLSSLPDGFIVSEPLEIKDQKQSDLCVGFSTAEVSEDQEGVPLSPEYQFAKIKQLMGDYQSWGADLRMGAKALCQYGSLPKAKAPFSLETHDRDFVANWENWDPALDEIAKAYRKLSFFAVDGPYDDFDNIRAALWLNRNEKQTVFVGCLWKGIWTNAPGGIVPKETTPYPGFGHAFKLYGWKKIEGETFLIAQLSNGLAFGDRGRFYFPREVVNRDFAFGLYTFKDLPKEEAKKISWSRWQRFVEALRRYFKAIWE